MMLSSPSFDGSWRRCVRAERLLPERVLELDELALLGGGAARVVRRQHDLRVDHQVLEHHADLAVVLLDELLEGRTDPLAVGSSEIPGLDNCDERLRRAFDLTGLDVGRRCRPRTSASGAAPRAPAACCCCLLLRVDLVRGSRAPRRSARSCSSRRRRAPRACRCDRPRPAPPRPAVCRPSVRLGRLVEPRGVVTARQGP